MKFSNNNNNHTKWALLLRFLIANLVVTRCAGTGNAFRAQTFFYNSQCSGTPYLIQFTDYFKNPTLHQGCVLLDDGTSMIEEGGIGSILFGYAKKGFMGTSLVLQNAIEGCGRVSDFVNVAALAATNTCFAVPLLSGMKSTGAEIRDNPVTWSTFTDAACQHVGELVQFKSGTKKTSGPLETGSGYCYRGWFWQEYDAAGQSQDDSAAPAPTQSYYKIQNSWGPKRGVTRGSSIFRAKVPLVAS